MIQTKISHFCMLLLLFEIVLEQLERIIKGQLEIR